MDGGATDIHSTCATVWNYNDDGGVFAISGNPRGAKDLIGIEPLYVSASSGNFTPTDTTVLNWGLADTVTSAAYLGAMP